MAIRPSQHREKPSRLVLLDIVMPGIDGYESAAGCGPPPPPRDVPVMFLSSLEEVSQRRWLRGGRKDYLTKPFEVLEVKARVRSQLKAKAYSDAVKEKVAAELAVALDIQLGNPSARHCRYAWGHGFGSLCLAPAGRRSARSVRGAAPR